MTITLLDDYCVMTITLIYDFAITIMPVITITLCDDHYSL